MVDKVPPQQYEEEKEETLATPGVIDKYQEAGKIANAALQKCLDKIQPGVNIIEITKAVDTFILDETKKVFIKKRIEKGIAFPTCLSKNEICGHFSPLTSDATEKDAQFSVLQEGDVVKIDLGVHFDGFMALVAHTVVCQADKTKPVVGKAADVILAAHKCAQAAFRLLKAGNTNNQISRTFQQIHDSYHVNGVEGVLSHDLKKHLIDGNNVILNKETFEQKVDDHEFQINEVYAVDVIVSTGEGKPKECDLRTTVFKRDLSAQYNLKTKHGRQFMHEVNERCPTLCFSINQFEDEITAKLGVSECQKHQLLVPYPILTEKQGDIVAQFKYTIMILQGGTIRIAGLDLDEKLFQTENKIADQSINDLLALSMDKSAQKKNKKQANKQE